MKIRVKHKNVMEIMLMKDFEIFFSIVSTHLNNAHINSLSTIDCIRIIQRYNHELLLLFFFVYFVQLELRLARQG